MNGVILNEVLFWIGLCACLIVGVYAPRLLLLPFKISLRVLDRMVDVCFTPRSESKRR